MIGRAVVGVIGHVDHGKTALVHALTGTCTDRLPEERARGISVALGFAHLGDGERTVDLIDMPGHERFVRTMIAGATGIDAVLLVVAANEGIMPQTREHVAVAGLLGLSRALVAVTKCDLVDADTAALVGEEAAELLERAGMAPLRARKESRYVLTSTHDRTGIAQLTAALLAAAGDAAPRRADGLPFLPIDRAFAIPGHGPVVTGTLRGAPVRAGDVLELHPAARPVRVRVVQVHGHAVDAALPGQRAALGLRDVAIADLARGMALGAPGVLRPSTWLTLALTATSDAPPLVNGLRLRALVGTAEVDARLRLLDRDVLEPGAAALAQLHLATALACPAREAAIVRLASPARTVGGGRVLEPVTRRRRRHDPAALARLARLRDLGPEDLVAAEAGHDTTLAELVCLSALAEPHVRTLLAALPPALAVIVARGGAVLREADVAHAATRIAALIALAPAGLSRNQLGSALPGIRAPLREAALARLLASGDAAWHGAQLARPDATRDHALAADAAGQAAALAETLRLAGLTPPNPAALLADAATKRTADRLLRDGTLVRAVDRAKGRELVFHRDAIAAARERLAPSLEDAEAAGGLLVTEIAAQLGISRKFVMPLLDHLDQTRFTRRIGDRRVRFVAEPA